jgi:hypothetical protein
VKFHDHRRNARLQVCWHQRVEGWLGDEGLARLFILALFADASADREAAARRFHVEVERLKFAAGAARELS